MKQHRNLLASGTLIGDKVVNQKNEDIGTIEEFMIALDSGRIAYAVMSFGGMLHFGNKFFAVPWKVLRVDQDNKCFVINVDKERLEKAPGFDKDHWPDMTPEWTSEVNSFYEYTP